MKHISLGELDVSRIGLGTMAMSLAYRTGVPWNDAMVAAVERRLSPTASAGPLFTIC